MGFDASTAVEPLDYNFEKYGGGKGTTPEPSEEAIDLMLKKIRDILADVMGQSNNDPEGETEEPLTDILEMYEAMPDKPTTLAYQTIRRIIGEFTQGIPSEDDLAKLPFRVQKVYFGWLIGQFRPEL